MRFLLYFFLYFLAFFILFAILWIKNNFGSPSIEAILFHISFGREIVADAPDLMVKDFIIKCIIPSIMASSLGILINFELYRKISLDFFIFGYDVAENFL